MADRIADNADLAVDELRRRGRRRLVGAIVVALAAAIIVPLLLEQEPRPLGDDVSVQIPPVDEGKFISRLTGKPGSASAPLKSDARTEPRAAVTEPDAKREPPAAPAPATTASAAPAAKAAAVPPMPAPTKSIAEAEQRMLTPATDAKLPANTKVGVAATPAPTVALPAAAPPSAPVDAKAKPEPQPPAAPAKANGFVVQLAAFADDKGANALANKLKKNGYAAYVEPVQTSRGTLWRVRVGGYAARADADAARVQLKGEGYSGIVAAAK